MAVKARTREREWVDNLKCVMLIPAVSSTAALDI